MIKLINKLLRLLFGEAPLGAENIISAVDCELRKVPVPEWGGFIYLRGLTVDDRIVYLARTSAVLAKSKESPAEASREYFAAQIHLLTKSIADASGNLIFDSSHVEALAKKSSSVIARLCDEILVMNQFAVEAVEEEAKK